MGCCACADSKTDIEELEEAGDSGDHAGHSHGKSWHDGMSYEDKMKVAKENAASDCLFCKCCGIFGAWSGLQCCCCYFDGGKPFLSIKKDRSCTDIPCLLFFIATLGVQFVLVMYSMTTLEADPRWLLYYSDLYGQLCAPSFDEFEFTFNVSTAGNYAAWPDIRIYDVRVCVDHCNDTLTDERIVTPSFDSDVTDVDYDTETGLSVDLSGYHSINILEAICIPDPKYASDIASAVMDADYSQFETNFDQLSDKVALAMNDLSTARELFILCAFTAGFVSMIWGLLIRRIGTLIIWISIGITLLGFGLLSFYLIDYSQYAYLFGYTQIGDIMYYTGIVIGIADGMFALAVCAMWNRIRLAIAIAKETTRALTTLWTLFLYPLIPFVAFCLYFLYWIFGALYMSSVTVEKEWPMPAGYKIPYYEGGPTLQSKLNLPDEDATYTYLEIDDNWQYINLFHFFVLLWVTCFISYHTYMVIAGVYAEWYFADWKDEKETKKWRGSDEDILTIDGEAVRNEKDLDKVKAKQEALQTAGVVDEEDAPVEELKRITKLGRAPVCGSFWRVTRYHLGTIAFGSFLIALIEFIEYTLTYWERKFIGSEPSPMQKLVLCIIKCVLRCVKCVLNRINRNGLIVTSVYGWPFCAASMKGIALIFKNVVRSSALAMVSGYLEKLGKICIIAFNLGICMLFATKYYGDSLSSLLLPAVICFGITFMVCWQYMHLYEVGISTIFICFLIDEERNKSLQEMKASRRLQKIIGAHKPTKAYLISQAKSVRNVGLMDKGQREHFADEANVNKHDLKSMESVGNLHYSTGLKGGKENSHSSSHSLSLSDEERGRNTTIDALEIESNIKKKVKK